MPVPAAKLDNLPTRNPSALSVLFIGGHSRSGSTLLSRLLGEQPSAFSTGELTFIGSRGYRDNQLCGCSRPFRECPFWTEVVAQACGPNPSDWFARFDELQERLNRIRYMPSLAFQDGNPSLPKAGVEILDRRNDYAEMLSSLLHSIASVAGVDVVVDSSKQPPYGFLLNYCNGITLYPLHLVRDCRAVAFSQQRVRIRPEIHWTSSHMPRFSPAQSAIDWVLNNALMHQLGKTANRYMRIRYEDLALNPEVTLTTIRNWAIPDPVSELPAPSNSVGEHELSGNPMRFKADFKVSLDVEWMSRMPQRDKVITTAMSAPLLFAYGYPLKPPRETERNQA